MVPDREYPWLLNADQDEKFPNSNFLSAKRHFRRYGNPEATAAKYGIGIRELKARARREAWS
jgi:hypothetical protein